MAKIDINAIEGYSEMTAEEKLAALEALELPDGSVAECAQDVDRYLKENNLSPAGDFSDAYRREVRFFREQAIRKDFFAEFINNYKRRITYEKDSETCIGDGIGSTSCRRDSVRLWW